MYKTVLLLLVSLLGSFSLAAQKISLNSAWEFQLNEANAPADLPAEDWVSINLPHTWNAADAHDDVRGYEMGMGWYKKSLFIPKTEKNNIFLKFEGANQKTVVYVNGRKAGEHKGGYTAFVVDITSFITLDAENEIAISVNNAVDPMIPPLSADFTFYGGIYRDLWLIRKTDSHFDLLDGSTKGVYLSTTVSEEEAELSINTKLVLPGEKAQKQITYTLFDEKMQKVAEANANIDVTGTKGEIETIIKVINPSLWSPDQPYLYTLEVTLKDVRSQRVEDVYVDRIGFRWFEMAEDRSFLLNGKPLKLIGVNRHQDFEGLGNALPDPIHYKDIQLLKEMGGNFIRIAHYPQDPAILEACDELGILAWEEIPIVNYITPDEAFTKNSINMVREMVRQHYNHTSVIMWGYMNEVLLRPNKAFRINPEMERATYFSAINELAKTLEAVCKEEDPSRFTTIAHHGNYDIYEEAGLNDIADIIGWNLYFGWYGADFNRLGAFLDDFHQKHPDKGIIVAEYGAGADPRIHADTPLRFDFSVEWQTAYHASYFAQIMDRPSVLGATAWNFVDFGSEGRSDAVPRINSKGVVNVDRSPKDAYYFYQAALLKEPYCKIGSLDWRNRTGVSNSNTLEEPVSIFSNQKEVELLLNGQSLGKHAINNFSLRKDIPFKAGENELVVKAAGLEDRATFQIDIIPSQLQNLSADQIDLCMNLGSHVDFYDPVRKQYWLPEQAYQKGGFGYVGGSRMLTSGWKVGTGAEIVGSDLEPVYQTHRDTIESFRADVPDGWYEVTLHFAEIYSTKARQKMANNLGADEEGTEIDINRVFIATINEEAPINISHLKDFQALPIKTRVLVKDGKGMNIQFQAQNGSALLSGVEIRGL